MRILLSVVPSINYPALSQAGEPSRLLYNHYKNAVVHEIYPTWQQRSWTALVQVIHLLVATGHLGIKCLSSNRKELAGRVSVEYNYTKAVFYALFRSRTFFNKWLAKDTPTQITDITKVTPKQLRKS